jgi:opacity protein-like surface antigen
MKLRAGIIAGLLLLGLGGTALAQDAKGPFQTGAYVGVHGGYQIGASELDLNAPAPVGSILNIDGLSSRGTVYGVHGGIDYRFSGSPWLLGVVAQWDEGDAEFDVSTGLGGGFNILHASISPTWKAGGRVGYAYGNALVYAGYAFANADLSITSGLAPGFAINRSMTGHNPFVGIEIATTSFVTVGLQYDYHKYNTEELLNGAFGPGVNLDLDTDVHSFTARVNLRLDGMLGQ